MDRRWRLEGQELWGRGVAKAGGIEGEVRVLRICRTTHIGISLPPLTPHNPDRIAKAIKNTNLDDAELKRKWADLSNTFDYSAGATKTGEEGWKVFAVVMGKVVFMREARSEALPIGQERREALERVAVLFTGTVT